MSPTNLAAFRISHALKQPVLQSGPLVPRANGHAAKLERAIARLGTKWVLHRSNNVKRLAEPLPENFVWQPARRRAK